MPGRKMTLLPKRKQNEIYTFVFRKDIQNDFVKMAASLLPLYSELFGICDDRTPQVRGGKGQLFGYTENYQMQPFFRGRL